jgi:hypothetical protein
LLTHPFITHANEEKLAAFILAQAPSEVASAKQRAITYTEATKLQTVMLTVIKLTLVGTIHTNRSRSARN